MRLLPILLCFSLSLPAQSGFLRGADLSYVNEMEDCGAIFTENGEAKDPYELFAENGCDIVRLRLWHTPSWYDTLNQGQRYSDFEDVCRSAERAREAGMQILLDFHLSDFWADPGRQWIPAAWEAVSEDLPVLQDSLYNYVHRTLLRMHDRGLLPEMVQIGNETNRGILLTPEENAAGWVLDWERNAPLFLSALQAVKDVEDASGAAIQTALHIAGPTNAEWLLNGFTAHGITDYDIIGLSYYWQWHQPTNIAQTGSIIEALRAEYPDKEVMVFETGYPWTLDFADEANNILTEAHPNYLPLRPAAQQQWMVDLSREVMTSGGSGVFYWEPAWVSTDCYTPWGQGSHKENAAFFDFEGEVLEDGGMAWFSAEVTSTQKTTEYGRRAAQLKQLSDSSLQVTLPPSIKEPVFCQLYTMDGKGIGRYPLRKGVQTVELPPGRLVAVVQGAKRVYGQLLVL